MDCKIKKEGQKNIYSLLLIVIVSVFLVFECYGSEKNSTQKVTAVEQIAKTPFDKQKMVSKHCESEVDKLICNNVFKAHALYYQIANHEPQGSYMRNNSMRVLAQSAEINMQSTIDEFGHSDSLDIYTAFISFVTLNEKAENLRFNQNFEGAGCNREMANENQSKIIDYCKTCVE